MSAVLDLLPSEKRIENNGQKFRQRAILSAIEDRQHAVFFDVSWEMYEELLQVTVHQRNPKLFYDQGVLEIMPKSSEHEATIFAVFSLIEYLAEQLEFDFHCIGQTTLTRQDLERGFEPDCSFYFQTKAELMRDKNEVNLLPDPSPDLIVEIDITHSSLDKFKLFAAVGIPEVWIFEEKRLKILQLKENEYIASDESIIFKNISSSVLTEFIDDSRKMKRPEWRKKIRQWARKNLRK